MTDVSDLSRYHVLPTVTRYEGEYDIGHGYSQDSTVGFIGNGPVRYRGAEVGSITWYEVPRPGKNDPAYAADVYHFADDVHKIIKVGPCGDVANKAGEWLRDRHMAFLRRTVIQ